MVPQIQTFWVGALLRMNYDLFTCVCPVKFRMINSDYHDRQIYYQFVNERGMICIYTQNENTWICNADSKCVITRLIHICIYIYT